VWRPPAHARTPAARQRPQPRREGLEAGAPLARALAEWACELPLGMQLVAAAHGAAGLATPGGLRLAAAEPRAAAAVRGMHPRDAVVVRACRPPSLQAAAGSSLCGHVSPVYNWPYCVCMTRHWGRQPLELERG